MTPEQLAQLTEAVRVIRRSLLAQLEPLLEVNRRLVAAAEAAARARRPPRRPRRAGRKPLRRHRG